MAVDLADDLGPERRGEQVARPVHQDVIGGLRWPLLFGACTGQQAQAVPDAQFDQIFGRAG